MKVQFIRVGLNPERMWEIEHVPGKELGPVSASQIELRFDQPANSGAAKA